MHLHNINFFDFFVTVKIFNQNQDFPVDRQDYTLFSALLLSFFSVLVTNGYSFPSHSFCMETATLSMQIEMSDVKYIPKAMPIRDFQKMHEVAISFCDKLFGKLVFANCKMII